VVRPLGSDPSAVLLHRRQGRGGPSERHSLIHLGPYLPSIGQVVGLSATLAVALSFVLIGRLVGGPRRLGEADLVSGWGIVTAVITFLGVFTSIPFSPLVYPLVAVALIALVRARREGWPEARSAGRALVLVLPLLLVATAMQPSQWDEFSQWLWSGRYLFDVGHFPGPGQPESYDSFPSYPKAMSFVMLLPSLLTGFFVENSAALFNVLLLAAFMLLLARLFAEGRGDGDAPLGWTALGVAFLASLAFPPFVVQKITLTAYAEVGTAVSLAFTAILGWRALAMLGANRTAEARILGWQLGLAATVLVSLKQANLLLFLLAMAGVVLAGLRMPGLPWRRLARIAIEASILPLAVYAAWRYHVASDPASYEKGFRPFADWEFNIIPQMLRTVVSIVLHKSGYFLAMFILAGMAIRALFRYRGPADGLALIAATVFGGYNAFLIFSYVASFGGYEGSHAASFWRYNMHLGPLGAAAWAYIAGEIWSRRRLPQIGGRWRAAPVGIALLLPLLLIVSLRFDLRAPKVYTRAVGAEIATLLPEGAKLAVVDPLDTMFYAKVMRYLVFPKVSVVASLYYAPPADRIQAELARTGATYAWVHTQDAAVRSVFGGLDDGASYLMEKGDGGWTLIKAWPYPGYRLPTDIPD
jgi:hypothetical protein